MGMGSWQPPTLNMFLICCVNSIGGISCHVVNACTMGCNTHNISLLSMGNIDDDDDDDDAMLHSAFESNFHLKRQHVNIMRARLRSIGNFNFRSYLLQFAPSTSCDMNIEHHRIDPYCNNATQNHS